MSIAATIEVPQAYGYVLLTCLVGPFVVNMQLTSNVMKARKLFGVEYPNLYGVPGHHDKADDFNRVQRGHQAMYETLGFFLPASLIGGLQHPIAVAVFGAMYTLGILGYQLGYMDTTLDVKVARYLRGGPIRYIGLFGSYGAVVSLVGTLLEWW